MVKVDRIVGKKEVREIVGLSDSTISRREKAGTFPKRIQLSPGRVGYRLSAVMEFIENCETTAGEIHSS